jgi:hypothetical protein
LEQKKLLVRELHHRVKNNLQTVLAFLNLADETEAPDTVHRRVHAMADTHELAMTFPDPTAIDLAAFVQRVASTTTRVPGQHVSVSAGDALSDAPPDRRFTLTVNQAVLLGMSLHEIIRSYEGDGEEVATIPISIAVAVNAADWNIEVRANGRRSPGPSATARALCGAWATQLGGGITYTDAAVVLTVPRENRLEWKTDTAEE